MDTHTHTHTRSSANRSNIVCLMQRNNPMGLQLREAPPPCLHSLNRISRNLYWIGTLKEREDFTASLKHTCIHLREYEPTLNVTLSASSPQPEYKFITEYKPTPEYRPTLNHSKYEPTPEFKSIPDCEYKITPSMSPPLNLSPSLTVSIRSLQV